VSAPLRDIEHRRASVGELRQQSALLASDARVYVKVAAYHDARVVWPGDSNSPIGAGLYVEAESDAVCQDAKIEVLRERQRLSDALRTRLNAVRCAQCSSNAEGCAHAHGRAMVAVRKALEEVGL
jgi:hypothetical protein